MQTVEQAKRYQVAKDFMDNLEVAPISWYVSGSTAKGTCRLDSDIDITALWEKDVDIPLPPETKPFYFMFSFKGYEIDLHSFAKEWIVFKADPSLLDMFEHRTSISQ
ncbi:MAG: nucleotidyltransferase domain-containing protein [Chloroflexota bacterium]|nr:MAG: nucleotidyltransferase domain-containing protein [Chloroflexota bacterium]